MFTKSTSYSWWPCTEIIHFLEWVFKGLMRETHTSTQPHSLQHARWHWYIASCLFRVVSTAWTSYSLSSSSNTWFMSASHDSWRDKHLTIVGLALYIWVCWKIHSMNALFLVQLIQYLVHVSQPWFTEIPRCGEKSHSAHRILLSVRKS